MERRRQCGQLHLGTSDAEGDGLKVSSIAGISGAAGWLQGLSLSITAC